MASSLTSSTQVNPQAQSAFRLPKLTYRNGQSDADSINTVSTNASRMTISTNCTSPLQSTFCPSPREPPVDLINSISPRSSSFAPSTAASRSVKNASRKKPSLFSGLFGAKEPSAQAFADYQKSLLKQGRGPTNTAGLPGVSSAKLPPTVPKVNSKWDGVPETLKEKEKQKHGFTQSIAPRPSSSTRSTGPHSRSSSATTSQRRLSRGTLGGTSTHSNGSNKLADLYGWEVNDASTISSSSSAVLDFATEHRPTTARLQTSHSAPAPSERPPPLDRAYLFPPHTTPDRPTDLQPQSGQLSPSTSDLPDVPSLCNSPALTPSEPSPATPDALPRTDFVSLESEIKTSQPDDIKTTILEAPASTDSVVIKSAGLNILGPPATAKRKAKALQRQVADIRPRTAGVDMPLTSILKKETRPGPDCYYFNISQASPATPLRHNEKAETAGLGMSLKNQAIAPWTSPCNISETTADDERAVTPTPEAGQLSRKKSRMSMFRK